MVAGSALLVILICLAGAAALFLLIAFFTMIISVVWKVLKHVLRFVFSVFFDLLKVVGAATSGVVMIPLIILNILVGRWSASSHYGRGLVGELKTIGVCLYRVLLAHPAAFLGVSVALGGIEKRLPALIAAAPGSDKPNRRAGQFDGYKIVGSLAGGGSGGKLYVAEPDAIKRAALERSGFPNVGQVVIKAFSLRDGSTLPQIVRESRALENAKRIGLVLDHELTPDRFFYAMPYVPGQSLTLVTQQLHAMVGAGGLDEQTLRTALKLVVDLLGSLNTLHRAGLWHKDVKPDNIIVDGDRAHLVDFGLVTPLASAMTLTTHGTEYFRDPELVRLALRGVKVNEVDGARFDLYAAGAVLFSIVENSFPAHGALSQITRRCPDALRWIIRRAMTDYDKRYMSAAEMLADVECVRMALDSATVRPADLPSMRGPGASLPSLDDSRVDPMVAQAASGRSTLPFPVSMPTPAPVVRERVRPTLRVANWLTGSYERLDTPVRHAAASPIPGPVATAAPVGAALGGERAPAHEQIARARGRAAAARDRVKTRLSARSRAARSEPGSFRTGLNAGVVIALAVFLASGIGILGFVLNKRANVGSPRAEIQYDDNTATFQFPAEAIDDLSADLQAELAVDVEGATELITIGGVSEVTAAPANSDAAAQGVTVNARETRRKIQRAAVVTKEALLDAARAIVAPVPAMHALTGDPKALFVVTLPQPLSKAEQRVLERTSEALRESGFEVRGYSGRTATGIAELKNEVEVIAGAVIAAGASGPVDVTSRANLASWIGARSDVQLVVWFKRPEADGQSPMSVEIIVTGTEGTPGEPDENAFKAIEALKKLV